jgi:polyhydroxyalkanoate synthesis regulator phasin
MIPDSYLNAYLDRRMKYQIEEWQLATRGDVADVSQRINALEQDLKPRRDFEKAASGKIAELELRLKRLKEARR